MRPPTDDNAYRAAEAALREALEPDQATVERVARGALARRTSARRRPWLYAVVGAASLELPGPPVASPVVGAGPELSASLVLPSPLSVPGPPPPGWRWSTAGSSSPVPRPPAAVAPRPAWPGTATGWSRISSIPATAT